MNWLKHLMRLISLALIIIAFLTIFLTTTDTVSAWIIYGCGFPFGPVCSWGFGYTFVVPAWGWGPGCGPVWPSWSWGLPGCGIYC